MKIKNLFIGLILIFIGIDIAFAQVSEKEMAKHKKNVAKSKAKTTAIVSLDTFFYAGEPQAVQEIRKKSFLGAGGKYMLLALSDGSEQVYVEHLNIGTDEQPNWVYDLSFIVFQAKLRINGENEKPLKILGEHNVFEFTGVNLENLNKLLLIKGQPTVDATPQTIIPVIIGGTDNYLVERDRNGIIIIIGNEVKQSNVTIGTIESATSTQEGTLIKTFTIRYINGDICAIAKNKSISGHDWTVTTYRNSKTFEVNASIGQDEKAIIKELIDRVFL